MGLNRVIVEFGKGALIYGIPASLYTRALKKNVRGFVLFYNVCFFVLFVLIFLLVL